MDGGLTIRPGRPEDAPALAALEARAFATDALDRRAFRHAARSPTMALRVALAGADVAGYAILERRRGRELARLSSIAVDPARAGRGLGRTLLAAVEAAAREAGCRRLRLEVRADNAPARRLYERAGYRRIGTVPDYYEDGAEAWRYEGAL